MEKENYLKSGQKETCTGCGACAQICPRKCINMVADKEGFKYPKIDKDKCVNCNKCMKVCPVACKLEKQDIIRDKKVYGYKLENNKLLLESSSGGAFTSIVDNFCKDKYAIFGVKFDENLNAVHDYITNKEQLEIFRKSKYVQSDINNSYIKVKQLLSEEYRVLFSGTPCQVAALKKFLNKNYENLLCVDIICHGVPSQKILNKYLAYVSKKYKSKVKSINFREKVKKDGIWTSKNLKLVLDNSKIIIEDSIKNHYLRGFQQELFYRPSCYTCKFANKNRSSDITIADCWGIENVDKDINFHEGYSMVVLNTIKGEKYFKKSINNKQTIRLNEKFAIDNNRHYSKPATINKNREKFFKNIDNIAFDKLIDKHTRKMSIRLVISKLLPSSVKNKIKNFLKK